MRPLIQWHTFDLNQATCAVQKNQNPCVFWFVGLSASGKSTMADLLGKALYERGKHVYLLDGDNLRHGLNRDLGFSVEDRSENIRRASEAAHLMVDAGLIVLAAFISPLRRDRLILRELFREDEFYEIFVDTPLEVCIRRDPKNLYAKAMRGEIPDFTGISSAFEAPLEPHLRLDGTKPPEILLEELLRFAAEKVRYKNPRMEDTERIDETHIA